MPATQGDMVFLKNVGDTEFKQQFGGKTHRILPGAEAIVSFEAMCLWLGHPDAVDIDSKRRYRTDEWMRLCVKWGIYEKYDRAPELLPKLEAYDLDHNRIITVADDPDGRHLTPDVQTKMERDNLLEQMESMKRSMAVMQAQLAQVSAADAAAVAAGDTRTDTAPVRPIQPGTTPPGPPPPVPNPEDEAEGIEAGNGGATPDRPSGPRAVARA